MLWLRKMLPREDDQPRRSVPAVCQDQTGPCMASEQHGSNRRSTYRFRSAEPSLADLVVAGLTYPVQINDESAGGLRVSSPGPLEISQGGLAELRTEAGWFEVRVVHVDRTSDATVLGLKRVCDRPMPGDSGPGVIRRLLAFLIPSIDVAQVATLVLGALLAVALVAIPVLLRNWHGGWDEPSRPRDPLPMAEQPAPRVRAAPDPPRPGADASQPVVAPSAGQPWLRTSDLLDLLDPETIRRLALSPHQEQQILALVQTLDDTDPFLDLDAPLADGLIDNLCEILTDRQQSQLQTPTPYKEPDTPHTVGAGTRPSKDSPAPNASQPVHGVRQPVQKEPDRGVGGQKEG